MKSVKTAGYVPPAIANRLPRAVDSDHGTWTWMQTRDKKHPIPHIRMLLAVIQRYSQNIHKSNTTRAINQKHGDSRRRGRINTQAEKRTGPELEVCRKIYRRRANQSQYNTAFHLATCTRGQMAKAKRLIKSPNRPPEKGGRQKKQGIWVSVFHRYHLANCPARRHGDHISSSPPPSPDACESPREGQFLYSRYVSTA